MKSESFNDGDSQTEQQRILLSVRQKFEFLGSANPQEIQEITEFTSEEAAGMRTALTEASLDLELSKRDLESLYAPQFRARPDDIRTDRAHHSDKVHAMLKIFGGKERLIDFLEFCERTGEEYGAGRIGKIERTEGRGLQQTAVEIIQISIAETPEQRQEALSRLNGRVRRGFERKQEYKNNPEVMQVIEERFPKTERVGSKVASVPPGSLLLLWDRLASGRNQSSL